MYVRVHVCWTYMVYIFNAKWNKQPNGLKTNKPTQINVLKRVHRTHTHAHAHMFNEKFKWMLLMMRFLSIDTLCCMNVRMKSSYTPLNWIEKLEHSMRNDSLISTINQHKYIETICSHFFFFFFFFVFIYVANNIFRWEMENDNVYASPQWIPSTSSWLSFARSHFPSLHIYWDARARTHLGQNHENVQCGTERKRLHKLNVYRCCRRVCVYASKCEIERANESECV